MTHPPPYLLKKRLACVRGRGERGKEKNKKTIKHHASRGIAGMEKPPGASPFRQYHGSEMTTVPIQGNR